MRGSLCYSVLLIGLMVTGPSQAAEATKPTITICLTGGLVKLIPSYGEAFRNGAQLAINNAQPSRVQFQLETHYYDPTALGPRHAIQQMRQAHCSVILGFSETNDLLAIRKLAKKHQLLVISMYGELNNALKQVPHILTMQPSPDYLVDRLETHLTSNPQYPMHKALIATAIDRASLLTYRDSYMSLLKAKKIPFDTLDVSERSFRIEKFRQQFLSATPPYDTVVLCVRAIVARKIAHYLLHEAGLSQPPLILGTENLGSSQLPAFQHNLRTNGMLTLFPRHSNVNDPSQSFKRYLQQYRQTFTKEPMVISGYAHDATQFIIAASQHLAQKARQPNHAVTSPELITAAKMTTFRGMLGVQIDPGLAVTYTKAFIIRVDKRGYNPVQIFRADR